LAESMKTDRHNVPIHSPNTKSNIDLPDTVSALGKGGFFNNLMKVSFQESAAETNLVYKENDNEIQRKKNMHKQSKSIPEANELVPKLKHSKTLRRPSPL
jgi:hypothetical protein